MSGDDPEVGGGWGKRSRLMVAIGALLVAVGAGAGLRELASVRQSDAAGPSPSEPESDVSEDRWAAVLRGRPAAAACAPTANPASEAIQTGVTKEGRRWIGAAEPVLEVQEFTDYRCPACRRAHMKVRRLLAAFPGRVRVVTRHLPMDPACNPSATKPFHDRACELSRIAYCAGRQGRFWETHEYLLQNADVVCSERRCPAAVARRLDLDEDAFRCCLEEPNPSATIAADIAEAKERGIRVTPTFLIGGRLYERAIPDEALAPLR